MRRSAQSCTAVAADRVHDRGIVDHADGGVAGACAEYDGDVGRCTVIRVNMSCVHTRSSGVNTYLGCLQQATTRPPCPHRSGYRLLVSRPCHDRRRRSLSRRTPPFIPCS